jgi:hypothetical protein
METDFPEQPRRFEVKGRTIRDMGKIRLEPGEMVSFVTPSGKENNVTACAWGWYTASSLNGRLRDEGFKTALVRNEEGKMFIHVVEADKLDEFHDYLNTGRNGSVLVWLDEWI